jgi:hypothetical protein
MDKNNLRGVYVSQAKKAYTHSDTSRWIAALNCSMVVGKYDKGATLGLADDMGVSVDTVEDLARAYSMFREMCEFEDCKYRKLVFAARRAPYIYTSHFRAIADAKKSYGLSILQALDLLMDVVQSEGGISSRNVDTHTREKFGDSRDWFYYAKQTEKKLTNLLGQPDLPVDVRGVASELFNILQEKKK